MNACGPTHPGPASPLPSNASAASSASAPVAKPGGPLIDAAFPGGNILVDKIEGDYYNVMGLPLSALVETLKEFGIDIWRAFLY